MLNSVLAPVFRASEQGMCSDGCKTGCVSEPSVMQEVVMDAAGQQEVKARVRPSRPGRCGPERKFGTDTYTSI